MGSCLGGDGSGELLRRRWRWGAVEEGDGDGELLRREWRCGSVEMGMEVESC